MDADIQGGILSQTLASSPCIKSILSARVRSPLLNDVVLVGHSSIHLREFLPSGQLTNILTELELGVQILAAKVISAEAHILSTEDAIFENGKDELRFRIRGQPCDDSQPPQIVMLSVASGEFIFVYARDLSNGTVQFVHARRHILGGRHLPRRYGKHLAIDSESRAVAVAAAKGSFGIMSLKHVDEIRADIDSWDPRNPTSIRPINEQRFVQVDGTILRMDFLRSDVTQPHRLVLLLIVSNGGTTRLLLYRWDTWKSLMTIKPLRCSGQPLPPKDSFPHLLIPSSRFTSFAIVTDQSMVFYDDLSSKKMKRSETPIQNYDKRIDKQWVQWAKPVRHEKHSKEKEDIFLVREDGLLQTIVVKHGTEKRTSAVFVPGQLGINVDTAVCALPAPPMMGGDILIACGDMTEGGVFHLAAVVPPKLLQLIPNWSPIHDIVHIDNKTPAETLHTNATVLAATGLHEGRSALTELRYGIDAEVGLTILNEEAHSIDRIWALDRLVEGKLFLLASHHEHTTLTYFDLETEEIVLVDSQTYPYVCYTAPTLVAANIANSATLQITTDRVNMIGSASQNESRAELSMDNIVGADVNTETGLFVVAVRDSANAQLRCGIAAPDATGTVQLTMSPQVQHLDYTPIEISLTAISEQTICILVSPDGQLELYALNSAREFVQIKALHLASIDLKLDDIKVSSIATLTLPNSQHSLIVCGLKSGVVLLIDMMLKPPTDQLEVSLDLIDAKQLGNTSVKTKVESNPFTMNERSAYITCGNSMHRILLLRNSSGLDFSIDPLLVRDRHAPAFMPPSISAVDRVGRVPSAGETNPSGMLVCAAGNELLLLGLGSSTMLPRPVRAMRPTKHLIYCAPLGKCIAANRDVLRERTREGDRPSLHLYDPTTAVENSATPTRSTFHFGEKGERVRALLHWAPTDGNVHHDFIIIGTDLDKDGRLAFVRVNRLAQPKAGATAKHLATYANKPINAICQYGMSSLAICAGRELKLLTLDLETKRWQHSEELELPSKALHLEARGSVIYVATSLHSFMLVKEVDGKLQMIASDSYAGKALNIVPYGTGATLINLVSDTGSRLLNFAERPKKGSRPTSEVIVPQAIDHLVPLNLPLTSTSEQRHRFLGTTIDGTVYLFTTLTSPEMRLFRFLEELCEPIRVQAVQKISMLGQRIAREYGQKIEGMGITPPSDGNTHAHGDLLKALLMPGPYNLHFLLQKRVKMEDAISKEEDEAKSLRDVAGPVLGNLERGDADVVDEVVRWLRRLLNVPAF